MDYGCVIKLNGDFTEKKTTLKFEDLEVGDIFSTALIPDYKWAKEGDLHDPSALWMKVDEIPSDEEEDMYLTAVALYDGDFVSVDDDELVLRYDGELSFETLKTVSFGTP